MIPSWYDVLDVEPDASTDEIRAAWKSAVAELDPTDRRFKQRNRAAEVLLDPQRRAAHDADLAAQDLVSDEPDDPDEPVAAVSTAAATGTTTTKNPATKSTRTTPRAATTTATTATTLKSASVPADTSETADTRWLRATIGAGVLAAVLLVATLVALVGGSSADAPVEDSVLPDAREVAAARAAAEAAIGPVLSFDYRDLEASKAAAVSFMTTDYAETYSDNFDGFVAENAPTTRTIVTAEVVSSGIVRTGEDRVDVLLFVNRPTRNASGDKVSRDQVTVQMRDVDGRWLVDCLVTAAGGSCEE